VKYVKESQKSVAEAASALERAVVAHGFGVLHQYDLKATLESKGQRLPQACRIFEVCNPAQAAAVLTSDMTLNMALPCRISVYDDAGRTKIGMIMPTALLGLLSDDRGLQAIGREVEAALEAMIDDAA
jgi:uncharacterized protein (DUF302 family)